MKTHTLLTAAALAGLLAGCSSTASSGKRGSCAERTHVEKGNCGSKNGCSSKNTCRSKGNCGAKKSAQ